MQKVDETLNAEETQILLKDQSQVSLWLLHVPPVFCPKALPPPLNGFAVAVPPKAVVPAVLEPKA